VAVTVIHKMAKIKTHLNTTDITTFPWRTKNCAAQVKTFTRRSAGRTGQRRSLERSAQT